MTLPYLLPILITAERSAYAVHPTQALIQLEKKTVKANIISKDYLNLRFVWLATAVFVTLLAVVSVKTVQGRVNLKAGQMPKEKIARKNFSSTDGQKFSLESMKGNIVVVNFFGAWCGYSKREAQWLSKLVGEQNNSQLKVVGMSVKDPRTNSQNLKLFVEGQNVNYPVVNDVEDQYFMDFVESTDVSVPQTLIYSRDGRLLAHFNGYNQQVGDAITTKVKEALAGK